MYWSTSSFCSNFQLLVLTPSLCFLHCRNLCDTVLSLPLTSGPYILYPIFWYYYMITVFTLPPHSEQFLWDEWAWQGIFMVGMTDKTSFFLKGFYEGELGEKERGKEVTTTFSSGEQTRKQRREREREREREGGREWENRFFPLFSIMETQSVCSLKTVSSDH